MKILEGTIISTKMNNTAIVEIYRKTPHPIYQKLIKRSKKFKVDNSGFEDAGIGTAVQITETRPISKEKYFKITKIVGQSEIKNKKTATTAPNAALHPLADTKKRARSSLTKAEITKRAVRKTTKKPDSARKDEK